MTRFIIAVCMVLGLAAPAFAKLEIQEMTSAKGINAWVVEEHSIPFIAIQIIFKGGTSLDLPGKRGATYMMSGLLEEGAGDLDAAAFQSALESLAASFDFDAHGDSVTISAKFLTENKDQALALLKSAIQSPRFDPDAVDRVRAQVISIIAGDRKDPSAIAADKFDALAFGEHPYGAASTGTPETVNALKREDLITAHQNALARDRVYVAVVGDITPEQAGPMLDALLGDLPETGSPMPPRASL